MELLEQRLMLSAAVGYFAEPPAESVQAPAIVGSMIPGDLTGDHRVDLEDVVHLKQTDPADLLGRFEALKVNFGEDARNWEIHYDPSMTESWYTYTMVVGSLFVDGAEADDVEQGLIGDCYFLATLAALADADPAAIHGTIGDLGDDTYIVKLYRLDGSDEPLFRISGMLPTNQSGNLPYAKMSPDGELWVALLEKAYAIVRYHATPPSYFQIVAGWPMGVFMVMTGDAGESEWVANFDDIYGYIDARLDDGYAVTLVSKQTDAGPRVVSNHVYAVTETQVVDGQTYITTYNPHGYYQTFTAAEISAAFRLVTAAAFRLVTAAA